MQNDKTLEESAPEPTQWPLKYQLMVVAVMLVVIAFIWATDKITLQGERTVYTVECSRGSWEEDRCNGVLLPGPRYRFRALKPHAEVIFWRVGATEPSAKLVRCVIEDGRNWICPESADSASSITLSMSQGVPVRDPNWKVLPFHAVSKVTWVLLRTGLSVTDTAQ